MDEATLSGTEQRPAAANGAASAASIAKMRTLVSVLLLLATAAIADAPGTLPTPTGRFAVGRTTFNVGQEKFLLFYPARAAGSPAPYVNDSEDEQLLKGGYYQQTPETIRGWTKVVTHSTSDAAPARGRFPLLLFLPGAGVVGFQYTAFSEELASHGYIVALEDYFAPDAPARSYDPDDSAAMENDMTRVALSGLNALAADKTWSARIDLARVGALGHSIGGAAAIGAARQDKRVRASIDMDGAPFGDSLKGAIAPVLVLRSHPLYSDADLQKRGRTREQMEKAGAEARRVWSDFKSKSNDTPLLILSVQGTGHFSFTDSPFVMPDAITRFGGKIIAPERGAQIVSTCLLDFFDGELQKRPKVNTHRCEAFPEVVSITLPKAGSKE